MKNIIAFIMLTLLATPVASTAEKTQAGPKGGRLLEKTSPRAEFFLEKDRTATITFYDASMKPVSAAEQIVILQADAPSGKQRVDFEKKGDVLASKGKLPAGDAYNVVVQFKGTPDAKPQNYRFKLDTSLCAGCKFAEYACACHE